MRKLVVLATLVAGCAAVGPPRSEGAELAQLLEGRVAGDTRTCVPVDTGRSLQVIDSRTLVYHDGATVWVSRLPGECPGLRPYGRLIVEVRGGQYCRGDQFRELEWGAAIPGPTCFLGDFTAYRRPR